MEKIYIKNDLNFTLTDKEYNDIEKVWKLIHIFSKPYIHLTDYRSYLIRKMKRYTVDEFYYLESIINKLFWNLRYKFNSETDCQTLTYENSLDLDQTLKKINLGTFYRSFINKLIIIDTVNKKIYYKRMEGSSDIFIKSNFNLFTISALFDRQLYEKVMNNPDKYKDFDVELPGYYHQHDYGFPNLNYCTYYFGDENLRKYRIKKLLFDNDAENWFKLLIN